MSRLALDPVQALAFVHVLELSSFLVRTHHHRLKFMLLSGDLLLRIGLLLHSNDTSVKLGMIVQSTIYSRPLTLRFLTAAIRFYRALVGLQDEFFNRFLIKNNILQSTMDVFAANGSRYNMLNSTVLEMLEFVRTVCGRPKQALPL